MPGITGVAGDRGDTGANGTPGSSGATGPSGDKGLQGPAGGQGPKGFAGEFWLPDFNESKNDSMVCLKKIMKFVRFQFAFR